MNAKLALAVSCVFVVISWPAVCAAQPTPTPAPVEPPELPPVPIDHGIELLPSDQPRLNEVLPRPRPGEHPWVEIWIPDGFSGPLALATASPEYTLLPVDLPDGGFVVIEFVRGLDDCNLEDPVHGADPKVRCPVSSTEVWEPTHGWIALGLPGV